MKNKAFLRSGLSTPDRNSSTTREFTADDAAETLCFQGVDPLNKYVLLLSASKYIIYYTIEPGRIEVAGVIHANSDPRQWQQRI